MMREWVILVVILRIQVIGVCAADGPVVRSTLAFYGSG